MNKQDRQNKTILKRKREREREILVACQPPRSPFANVTMGESSTLCRKQGCANCHAPHTLGSGKERGGHATSQREADLRICIISLLNAGLSFLSRAGY